MASIGMAVKIISEPTVEVIKNSYYVEQMEVVQIPTLFID